MSDLNNDNRLEQLSRKAADAYAAPGEASWEKMEAALDKIMPVEEKKRRRFIFWWLFPLVLLVGAGILYTLWPDTTVTTTPATATAKNKTDKPEKNTSTAIEQEPDRNTITTKDNRNNTNLETVHNIVTAKTATAKKQKGISSTTPVTTNNRHSLQVTDENIDKSKAPTQKQTAVQTATAIVAGTDPIVKINTSSVNSIHPTIDSGSRPTTDRIIEKTDTSIQVSPTDTLETRNEMVKKEKTKESRFSFALLAGMDASTVKFTYTNKSGINAGLILGYHVNEQWSLHTGIIYTKKNYTVAGEDFHAPKNSWYPITNLPGWKAFVICGNCHYWFVISLNQAVNAVSLLAVVFPLIS